MNISTRINLVGAAIEILQEKDATSEVSNNDILQFLSVTCNENISLGEIIACRLELDAIKATVEKDEKLYKQYQEVEKLVLSLNGTIDRNEDNTFTISIEDDSLTLPYNKEGLSDGKYYMEEMNNETK